jgi:hypothetical protein
MTQPNDDGLPFTPRRGFLGRLLGGTAAFTLFGAAPSRLLGEEQSGGVQGPGAGEAWMDALKAKHRTVFDLSAHKAGKPLTQAKNYLDGWRDGFKVPETDLNLVIGVHGDGIPIVLTDAIWAKYKIGEQYEVTDGGTKAPGVRNVFSTAHATEGGLVTPEQSVEGLQKRGVHFIVCMNTIAGAVKKLSGAGLGGADEIRAAIIGGLLRAGRSAWASVRACTPPSPGRSPSPAAASSRRGSSMAD